MVERRRDARDVFVRRDAGGRDVVRVSSTRRRRRAREGESDVERWVVLCATHRDSFSLFGLTGETRRMPLGFEAASASATSEGLLFVSRRGGVYIVAHALDAPTRVDGLSDAADARVVWSDARRPLVLTYVPSRRTHELWTLSLVPAGSETEFSDAAPEFTTRADLVWTEKCATRFRVGLGVV